LTRTSCEKRLDGYRSRSWWDVAMEASDAFGPLKAALGVMSAIYESYEVRL